MAKYQKYAEYKDSGVEWLGEIPSHWTVSKIGFHTSKIGSGKTPKGGAEIYQDEGVLFLRSQNIYNNGLKIEESESVYITDVIHQEMSTSKVFSGDILLNITGGSIGRSCLVPLDFPEANVNQHVCIIRVPNHLNEFLSLVIKADLIQSQIGLIQTGGNREGLNFEQISKFVFMLPSQEEQKIIIDFLDHETAKIDSLIAKQEKLIELLKEKRQAVISHAVTKGLNPDVKMKDSGVEWLGQVPEHWTVAKIKHLSEIISKGTTPTTMGGDFVSEGVRFLKAENIGKKPTVNSSPEFFISENVDAQLVRSRLQENDVLVIIAGATTGLSSVLQKELLPANTNQAVSFIRPKETAHAKWISYWLSTHFAQSLIWMGAVQAAQPNLSMESLGNIDITLPCVEEVKKTLDFIDKTLLKIDDLIEKNIKAIDFMQERRTALISSAVTGKINVTNWQNPNYNNNEANTELGA